MMEPMTQMTKNKKIKYTIKSILLGIVASLVVTMSILSFPFKRYSDALSNHFPKHSKIISARDKAIDSLRSQLGVTLSIPAYKEASIKLRLHYKNELQQYKIIKNKLKKENVFLGRTNFKFWLFQFGIVVLGLYFSVKSLLEDYRKKIRTGHEIVSLLGISVSLFWTYHLLFKTAQDFYTQTYVLYEVGICIATAFLITKMIKYYLTRHNIIRTLIDLILRIKSKHFRSMTVKALYAEKNDASMLSTTTVKQQANEFDKDVINTMHSVLK